MCVYERKCARPAWKASARAHDLCNSTHHHRAEPPRHLNLSLCSMLALPGLSVLRGAFVIFLPCVAVARIVLGRIDCARAATDTGRVINQIPVGALKWSSSTLSVLVPKQCCHPSELYTNSKKYLYKFYQTLFLSSISEINLVSSPKIKRENCENRISWQNKFFKNHRVGLF
jgi:hypothetical protein